MPGVTDEKYRQQLDAQRTQEERDSGISISDSLLMLRFNQSIRVKLDESGREAAASSSNSEKIKTNEALKNLHRDMQYTHSRTRVAQHARHKWRETVTRVINGEHLVESERNGDLERPLLRPMSAHGLKAHHEELEKFLTNGQRRKHVVTVKGTQLTWRKGEPLHGEYRYALSWLPNSCGLPSQAISEGRAHLFVAPESDDSFKHSFFLGGMPVLCAGMIFVIDGILRHYNTGSGHYCPSDGDLDKMTKWIEQEGLAAGVTHSFGKTETEVITFYFEEQKKIDKRQTTPRYESFDEAVAAFAELSNKPFMKQRQVRVGDKSWKEQRDPQTPGS